MAIITIFGATGFIGRSLTKRLAHAGHTLRIASRAPMSADCLRLKTAGVVGQIVPVGYNPRSLASIKGALAGSDIVINCVGILFERGRNSFKAIHVDFAKNIAEAAAAAGAARLMHLSALGADITSASRYAKSKAEGEAAVRAAFPRATILRPSVVFGADDGFINLFALLAKFFPALPLIGGGHTRFQPVFVGDIAEAVATALADEKTCSKIYELGGPGIYSFKEILQYIMQQTRLHRPLISLPWGIAKLQAAVLQLLPKPLLTPDQVILLQKDNVVQAHAYGFKELGIIPEALEVIAPTYLARYRPGGPLAQTSSASEAA